MISAVSTHPDSSDWLRGSDITIDIEYNKSLDLQRPCLEDELNAGSNNIVQNNKSI